MTEGPEGPDGPRPDEHPGERPHLRLGDIVREGLGKPPDKLPDAVSMERTRLEAERPVSRRWALAGVSALAVLALAAAGVARLRQPPSAVVYLVEGAGAPVGERGEAKDALLRFSDGSTVTLAGQARGRVLGTSAAGARLELLAGRARLRLQTRPGTAWSLQAGPYVVSTAGGELDVGWSRATTSLTVVSRAGEARVQGPGAEGGLGLAAGERLFARASDGLVRVGAGRAPLGHSTASAEVVVSRQQALGADPGESVGADAGLDGPIDPGACPATPAGLAARAVPDPGPVNLLACQHQSLGPTGKDVRARPGSDLWVQTDASGCLKYTEDPQGNRVPDFSFAGYHAGGTAPPQVPTMAEVAPGVGGDDTAAIQAAIDEVSALPADARGQRGAVELGAGTFNLKGTLRITRGGVVLRGQGSEGSGATWLRGVGAPHTLVQAAVKADRKRIKSGVPITDVYVPVGARSFELQDVSEFSVGDDIIVAKPWSPRWVCALGMDAPREGRPWRATSKYTFERRITRIEGKRVTVDVPLTIAIEKEYAQGFVFRDAFPERVSEMGVEHLAGRADFAGTPCPPRNVRFVSVGSVVDGWVRDVRAEGFGGAAVELFHASKWITVMDAAYAAPEPEVCSPLFAFELGGQQNLILRGRAVGAGVVALNVDSEVEGPNAVVDFQAVGKGARLRGGSFFATGTLFDNVRVVDALGQPAGEIELRLGAGGWNVGNSVVWNSEAETVTVDSPPTAQNWVVLSEGAAVRALQGTGSFSVPPGPLRPTSLYRAQLAERRGGAALDTLLR